MENKIRQLTDKLYEEGLQKGKTESDKLIFEAKATAEKIISDAQKKGDEIIIMAQKKSDEVSKTTLKDVKIASQRVISDSMQSIKEMLSEVAMEQELKNVFNNNEFVSKLIITIVDNWSKQDPNSSISIAVPESAKPELDKFITAKTFENLKKELEIKPDNKVVNGFRITSDKTGFYVSFTDEQFNNFFKGYLRDKVSEIVFDNK